MIQNNLFWLHQIKVRFLPEIDYFAWCLEEKIISAFNDIDKEADKVESEAFENPTETDLEHYDPSDEFEKAFEEGLKYYMVMNEMRQAIINLFTAGLYHIFEQHLILGRPKMASEGRF